MIDTAYLTTLLQDTEIEDIVLNVGGIAFFKKGNWNFKNCKSDTHTFYLKYLSKEIAEQAATSLGLQSPSVDAFITDTQGTVFRAHVVIPPLAPMGTEITLRRLVSKNSLFLLDNFSQNTEILEKLKNAVRLGRSMLISGATGSGKTSLIAALMSEIPQNQRVIILEDSPELPILSPLTTKLLSRNNRFGFREGATWDLSHLVFESLRMRPSRLILGECRGKEAMAIAAALKTGHCGVMATIHAGSNKQALERFTDLAGINATKPYDCGWDLCLHLQVDPVLGTHEISELTWNPS